MLSAKRPNWHPPPRASRVAPKARSRRTKHFSMGWMSHRRSRDPVSGVFFAAGRRNTQRSSRLAARVAALCTLAPGAAAAYAAKGLYNQRHHLVALFVPRVVVVAPVEGDVALACLVVKGREAVPRGGLRRLVTGAASEDYWRCSHSSVLPKATRCPTCWHRSLAGAAPSGEGTLVSPIQSAPQALAPGWTMSAHVKRGKDTHGKFARRRCPPPTTSPHHPASARNPGA